MALIYYQYYHCHYSWDPQAMYAIGNSHKSNCIHKSVRSSEKKEGGQHQLGIIAKYSLFRISNCQCCHFYLSYYRRNLFIDLRGNLSFQSQI